MKKESAPKDMKTDVAPEASFIVLTTGQDMDGQDFWAYVAVPYAQYDAYQLASSLEGFDLESYGTVLAYGLGDAPPENIRTEMQEKYQLDESFEEKLQQLKETLF